jgi:DNA-binding NarL/FixJ family response regulator
VTSVLIVDDQPMQRFGFRMLLESQDDLTVAGEAGDGAEAVRLTARLHPDVVLMDIRMPGLDGIEATRRIVASGARTRVLILTTFDLDEYAYDGLRAGASGFLVKDALPEELLSGIRAVATGDAVVAPSLTRRLLDAYVQHLPATNAPQGPDPRIAAPHGPGTRDPHGHRQGLEQHGDRRTPPPGRIHGQNPRGPHPRQNRHPGPRPGGHPGLRHPARRTGLTRRP